MPNPNDSHQTLSLPLDSAKSSCPTTWLVMNKVHWGRWWKSNITLQYNIDTCIHVYLSIYIYLTSIHKQQHPKWVAGKSIKDNQITRSCLFLTSKHAKSMYMYIHYTYIWYTYGWITSLISPTELCRETTFPSKLIWPCYEIYWDYPPKGHWVFSPQLGKSLNPCPLLESNKHKSQLILCLKKLFWINDTLQGINISPW